MTASRRAWLLLTTTTVGLLGLAAWQHSEQPNIWVAVLWGFLWALAAAFVLGYRRPQPHPSTLATPVIVVVLIGCVSLTLMSRPHKKIEPVDLRTQVITVARSPIMDNSEEMVGQATIIQAVGTQRRRLSLTQLHLPAAADVRVQLHTQDAATDIGALRANLGQLSYPIPKDLGRIQSVVFYSNGYGAQIAEATFRP